MLKNARLHIARWLNERLRIVTYAAAWHPKGAGGLMCVFSFAFYKLPK